MCKKIHKWNKFIQKNTYLWRVKKKTKDQASAQYTSKSGKAPKLDEPVVGYMATAMPLHFLADMSPQDLGKAQISGDVLTGLQEETSLSAQAIADAVGVSKSKYYELIKQDRLSLKNLDALADFATLWQKGIEAFDDDQAILSEWMQTRNTNLGGIKPIELVSSRMGRRELEKAFSRIEHGLYG